MHVIDISFSSVQSCELSKWVEHAQTQVVQTCWAAMALMYAQYPNPSPIERAVRLVMSRQNPVSVTISPKHIPNLILTTLVGRLMATRSDRGRVQQERRDRVSQLQILLHDLDARPRALVSPGAQKQECGHSKWRKRYQRTKPFEWTR